MVLSKASEIRPIKAVAVGFGHDDLYIFELALQSLSAGDAPECLSTRFDAPPHR